MESLKVIEAPEISQFEKIDNKEVIEINAKLEILKLLGGIVDSLREGLTRSLVVNGIKDEELLEKRLNSLDVINEFEELKITRKEDDKKNAYKHYIDDVGEIEP